MVCLILTYFGEKKSSFWFIYRPFRYIVWQLVSRTGKVHWFKTSAFFKGIWVKNLPNLPTKGGRGQKLWTFADVLNRWSLKVVQGFPSKCGFLVPSKPHYSGTDLVLKSHFGTFWFSKSPFLIIFTRMLTILLQLWAELLAFWQNSFGLELSLVKINLNVSPMPHQYKVYCNNVEKKYNFSFSIELIFFWFFGGKTALNRGPHQLKPH